MGFENRTVTFGIDYTPLDRIAPIYALAMGCDPELALANNLAG